MKRRILPNALLDFQTQTPDIEVNSPKFMTGVSSIQAPDDMGAEWNLSSTWGLMEYSDTTHFIVWDRVFKEFNKHS